NSSILIGDVSWAAVQASRLTAFQINYGSGCNMTIKNLVGYAGRIGQAMRIGYSYNSTITHSSIVGAYGYGSGEGYGATIYYSTVCGIEKARISGCRHNILLQTATACDVEGNESTDDYISGIDLHGCASVRTRIRGNRITRADNY